MTLSRLIIVGAAVLAAATGGAPPARATDGASIGDIAALSRPLAEVVNSVRGSPTEARFAAAHAELVARGPGVLAQLRPYLLDKDPKVRWLACTTFDSMPRPGAEAMMPWLTERRADRVAEAVSMLGFLRAREAVIPLIRMRGHADAKVRAELANAFLSIGDRRAVIALIDMVENDNDPTVRSAAVEALGNLRDTAAEAVPYLESKALLPGGSDHCWALTAIGKPALPALRRVFRATDLEDSSREALLIGIRQDVGCGIDALDGLIPDLVANADAADPKVVDSALRALTIYEDKAKEVVPAAERLLRCERESTRLAAARCLLAIEPGHQAAIAALIRLARDSRDKGTRLLAVLGLGAQGPEAVRAVPVLKRLAAGDPDEDVRECAKQGLVSVQVRK